MKQVTLLEGGMGQELLRRSRREITSLWSADIMLHEPALVSELHLAFIKSGARVITLNTYTATPPRLARENQLHQLEKLHQLAMQAAHNAVKNSERNDVRIAGCLPPLLASYRPDVSLPFDQALSAYRQLVKLQAPASDLFICETMPSISDAKAACIAAKESGKPVWLALTVKDDNHQQLRSGEHLHDALLALEELNADATLLNCSQPEAIHNSWDVLTANRNVTGAYANGFVSIESLYPGGTVENLEARRDLNPEEYAKHAMQWVRSGASIVGGCCEIGPTHIQALHRRLTEEGFL